MTEKRLSARFAGSVLVLAILVAWLSGNSARAQLGIELRGGRATYVTHESVMVTLVLRNYTGNALRFGGEAPDGDVLFVLSRDGDPMLHRVALGKRFATFELAAGETRKLSLQLNQIFNFQKPGDYNVYAQATHPRLGQDYQSKSLSFGVREGISIWHRSFGVPTAASDGEIPARTVTLLRTHEQTGDELCMRIEDDRLVYAVIRLGRQIFGAEPECDIDAVSNIHILMRAESRLFIYRVYDYRGQCKLKKYYMLDETLPRLLRDDRTGRLTVFGGRLAVEGVDYTVSKEDIPIPATNDDGPAIVPVP
jgi:hypothetical protein